MRVLVAGFKHETNTFASNRADWAAFERGESFPKPTHGDTMLEMISKVDVSASGFASVAKRHGWTLVPSLWAGAVPSSYITDDAFERIAGFSHDLKAGLTLEQCLDSASEKRVIVNQQDANTIGVFVGHVQFFSCGRCRVTVVPAPGADCMANWPPMRCARSLMILMPDRKSVV